MAAGVICEVSFGLEVRKIPTHYQAVPCSRVDLDVLIYPVLGVVRLPDMFSSAMGSTQLLT